MPLNVGWLTVPSGVYDALALSGQVNPLIGGIAFIVLIYFCIKMHKEAQVKLLNMVERDKNMQQ